MGHCGSKIAIADSHVYLGNKAASSLAFAKDDAKMKPIFLTVTTGKSEIQEGEPTVILSQKLSLLEDDKAVLNNELVNRNILIAELQHNVKKQRTLMHEGRNIRSASLEHIQSSMESMKRGIDELLILLATNPPAAFAAKIKDVIVELQCAYRLQYFSQIGEQYTSIVENYLLSPDDKEEFPLITWVNLMIDMLSSETLIPIKKVGLLAAAKEYNVFGHKAVLMYSLVNLMQNAIKFTQPKLTSTVYVPLDITVSLNQEGEAFYFSIIDSGIGMDPDQTLRCLEPSYKRFSTVQGSGTGLSTVSSELKRVGGSIGVESTKGIGTSFKLTLPLTIVNKAAHEVDFTKLSVLLVDDNAINNKILSKMLLSIGVPLGNIFPVKNKDEATKVFKKQFDLGRPISIILSDLSMEGGSGFQLAEEVREFELMHFNGLRTPIIIVSGNVCTTEQGFEFVDGQLLKPVKKSGVISYLAKAASLDFSPIRATKDSVISMEGASISP